MNDMIGDMKHLAWFDAMANELQQHLSHYNKQANGITDKKTLLELRLKQNVELTEILRQQRRHLEYHLGMPVVPEVHYAECVMVGEGIGSAT